MIVCVLFSREKRTASWLSSLFVTVINARRVQAGRLVASDKVLLIMLATVTAAVAFLYLSNTIRNQEISYD
jgi:cell division protein FtsL